MFVCVSICVCKDVCILLFLACISVVTHIFSIHEHLIHSSYFPSNLFSRLFFPLSELERQRHSVLVVCHLAVLRCIFAYFMGVEQDLIPYQKFKRHAVYELKPGSLGARLFVGGRFFLSFFNVLFKTFLIFLKMLLFTIYHILGPFGCTCTEINPYSSKSTKSDMNISMTSISSKDVSCKTVNSVDTKDGC